MGIPTRGVEQANETCIRAVAQLGGAKESELLRFAPLRSPGGSRFKFAGEVFDASSINRTFFRFCPHCVLEDLDSYEGPIIARPWLRLSWILAPIRSCPEHNIQLVRTDPKRQQYQYFDFSRTMDIYRTELEQLAKSAHVMPPSSFQDWLLNRIRGTHQQETWLDDVPAYAAIAFCEGLGVSSLHPPKVMVSRLTEADWALAAEKGFLIASDGEASVRAQLKKLTDAKPQQKACWAFGTHTDTSTMSLRRRSVTPVMKNSGTRFGISQRKHYRLRPAQMCWCGRREAISPFHSVGSKSCKCSRQYHAQDFRT
jgi:hypothetical protein